MNATIAKATRVYTKERKHLGVVYPATATEYLVTIVKGKSIQLFKQAKDGTVQIGSTFQIGDAAEYDSYNLSYVGEIESITDKTITIVKVRGVSSVKHRLDLNTFCWRNFGFDLEKTRESNRIESMNL
jgi:hypothetical protein